MNTRETNSLALLYTFLYGLSSRSFEISVPGYGNVRVSGGLLIETAVLIPVSVLVAALLVPPAFAQVYGANTTGWNAAVITIFQILFPALAVLAIVFQYVRELTHSTG